MVRSGGRLAVCVAATVGRFRIDSAGSLVVGDFDRAIDQTVSHGRSVARRCVVHEWCGVGGGSVNAGEGRSVGKCSVTGAD